MPTALITGATSGFGQAAARAFVDAGWHVIGTVESPIHGSQGNQEFLLYARRG